MGTPAEIGIGMGQGGEDLYSRTLEGAVHSITLDVCF